MSSPSPSGLAFFDLDGTITRRDTFLAFIRFVHGPWRLIAGLVICSPFLIAYLLKQYPNDRLKARIFKHFFGGCGVAPLRMQAQKFGRDVLPLLCRPAALQVLAAHQHAGHRIYILTASAHLWLAPWCEQQGFLLIGTHFAVKNGKFTGELAGPNCYGPEKALQMQEILAQYPERHCVYAYGDQKADAYFLALADHAYLGPLTARQLERYAILPLP